MKAQTSIVLALVVLMLSSFTFAGELVLETSTYLPMKVNIESDVSKYALMFDLSKLPENCQIDLAHMVLTADLDESVETPMNLVVYPVTQTWLSSEVSLTGSTVSYSEYYSCIGLTSGKTDQAVDFPITEIVRAWVSGTLMNNGLIVMGFEDASSSLDISTDKPSVKAKLTIYYSIDDRALSVGNK